MRSTKKEEVKCNSLIENWIKTFKSLNLGNIINNLASLNAKKKNPVVF